MPPQQGPRVDPQRRAAAVARLRQLREADQLTSAHVRLAASGLGVTERSVWRWLGDPGGERGQRPGPRRYELSDVDREAYGYFYGSIATLHRARQAVIAAHAQHTGPSPVGEVVAAGIPVSEFLVAGWADARPVSLRTLERAFAAQMTPAERAAWTQGEEGVRAAAVYEERRPSPRNECWEMDHKALPILVLPKRGMTACQPWVTTIVDDGTRVFLGWAISLVPHAGTVLSAIRMAMVHDPARGPFGAIPAGVRIDRGLEFAAGAVREVYAALCVDPDRLPPFHAFRKGKVERIHRTIEQTMLHALPGFTKGPRNAAGKLYGPLDDRLAARVAAAELTEGGPMALERFVALFASWAYWYNTERPHSRLAGRTPLQAWNEDPGPLNRIEPGLLRHLLMAGDEAMIGKYGIRRNNAFYTAPELWGRGGQYVQIRYMPHDDRFLEVFLHGEFLCTAIPQAQTTDEQRAAHRAHAAEERKRLGRQRRKVAARGRATLVPLTADQGAVTEARVLPATPGDELAVRRGEDLLRRRARSNLLGLTDPTAGPVGPAEDPPDPQADAHPPIPQED